MGEHSRIRLLVVTFKIFYFMACNSICRGNKLVAAVFVCDKNFYTSQQLWIALQYLRRKFISSSLFSPAVINFLHWRGTFWKELKILISCVSLSPRIAHSKSFMPWAGYLSHTKSTLFASDFIASSTTMTSSL